MPELLFELGCEELPATSVRRAYTELEREITTRLCEAQLGFSEVRSMGTPRRLIVSVSDVGAIQPDATKDVRGPALKAAFGPDDAPTGALLGFCRSQGADLSDLRKDDTYVWVTKTVPGRPAKEVLAEVLPEAVRALTFDKTMRWGRNRMRFARPIRWILAALDGEPIPFVIESVASGLESRGHRFLAPDPFVARTLSELLDGLASGFVEPDPDARRARIEDGARAATSGTPEMTEALIEENVFLTEWPFAIEGEFSPDYLDLPEPVLVTAMAKHERFFPVRDSHGNLTNRFISIMNSGEPETVRRGNAWVLSARFNDAKFFFDEDQKFTMDDFLARTERMLFQESLGSVRERSDRLASLSASLAPDHASAARQAGLYAKADLATGLVGELASLQGVIGGEYARREGFPEDLCRAIACQYAPHQLGAAETVGHALVLADQLDKLAGYLGLNLRPTGSSDPFGLRRAVTILIENPLASEVDLAAAFDRALAGYPEGLLGIETAWDALGEIFTGRYRALWGEEFEYDVMDAGFAVDRRALLDIRATRGRFEVLSVLRGEPALVQTLSRPINLVAAAEKKGEVVESDLHRLDSAEGEALRTAWAASVLGDDPLPALRALQPAIDAFFESTMVMVEDPVVRSSRLGLLKSIRDGIARWGDLTKLVLE